MAKIKTYNNKKNIAGTVIKEKIKENKITKKELCEQLELMGIYINPDELLKMEKDILMIKDFELVALAKLLDIDLNAFKDMLEA